MSSATTALTEISVLKKTVAFAGNVSCSVFIVFCNKVLMGRQGHNFHYATTLSALHFLACSLSMFATQGRPSGSEQPRGKLPWKDLVLFTAVADASIISLNLSLLLNPVSTYQIAKLLVIPFVCGVEFLFMGSIFTPKVLATIALVVAGVGVVTVEEVSFDGSAVGLLMAGTSVAASGMQQILVRHLQQKHSISSNDLLSATAPSQAASLLLLGPSIDRLVSGGWVTAYTWTLPAMVMLCASCALAVGVNITQFMCLGQFSAVAFQVLGHSKTILVLLGSWLFLGESATVRKLAGMALAVTGMIILGGQHFPKHSTAVSSPGEGVHSYCLGKCWVCTSWASSARNTNVQWWFPI